MKVIFLTSVVLLLLYACNIDIAGIGHFLSYPRDSVLFLIALCSGCFVFCDAVKQAWRKRR